MRAGFHLQNNSGMPLRGAHVGLGLGHGHCPVMRMTTREGGFAGICLLCGLIFGTVASRVPDSALCGGHGGIWGFGKQSGGQMAMVRQIVG